MRWIGLKQIRPFLAGAVLACSGLTPAFAEVDNKPDRGPYVRMGVGLQWPDFDVLQDQNCAGSDPLALFGCGQGDDGRGLGAYGEFETGAVVDAAIGYRWTTWLRTEALMHWSPHLELNAQSNFLGAGTNQPVTATGYALAGFGVIYVDGPSLASMRPYVGAGLGASRTQLGDVTYRFPGISQNSFTRARGGSASSLAYLLTAGVSLPLSERLDLDLAYRWTDLGTVKTRAGTARIQRPNRKLNLEVGGTDLDLKSQSVLASLRWRF